MTTLDIMEELYNIRSLIIATEMASVLKADSADNSFWHRRWHTEDVINVSSLATQRLAQLIEKIDKDEIKKRMGGC